MPPSLSNILTNIKLITSNASKSSSHCITRGEKAEWQPIPNASERLLPELQKIYWSGVERELRDIILTLKAWQQAQFADVVLDDEKEDTIYGFDTFIDQVNETSRELAVLYAHEKAAKLKRTYSGEFIPHEYVLQNIARKFIANEQSKALKEEIRRGLEDLGKEKEDRVRRRARMLLQSAGWLDIDKLIEHRPPIDGVGFWKRGMAPQLKLQKFHSDSTPEFVPLRCTICTEAIRGSMFQCQTCTEPADSYICEDCRHEGQHRSHQLKKSYKHCILAETIDPATSRKLCACGDVSRIKSTGEPRPLFPVSQTDEHRATVGGAVQCNLLTLGELVAEAKYSAVKLKMNQRTLDQERQIAEARKREKGKRIVKDKTYEVISTETINEREADADIPFFVRSITDRYPFGNVHMALRLGPVVVENGVEHTQGGALITSRDPPCWQHAAPSSDQDIAYSLTVSADRSLFWQNRKERHPKRYKTALKQVVGGAFSGIFKTALEMEIIDLVLDVAQKDLENKSDSIKVQESLWKAVLEPILEKMHAMLDGRVNGMLSSIAAHLLDLSIPLKWDRQTNNCQDFCFNMLDYDMYGGFLPSHTIATEPLYLMSFICRPKSYTRERKVQSKFEIPSGLCEEYLLKFRYGFHVDSDILDSLSEYWYDWGAFGGPLYKYQDLFPWDCTEAYGRSSTRCGECNISKHVWSFPFDSWSIISLHLTRQRLQYPEVQSEQDWMKNRLQVLLAQDVLNKAARVMATNKSFRESTAWLTNHPDERMDRLKLGGIHRAQPYSHNYDEGQYHEYFIAHWAHLRREDQIAEYERMREERRLLPDVPIYNPYDGKTYDGDGGDGGDFWAVDPYLDVAYLGAYYDAGWDGEYTNAECMSAADAAQVGTTDWTAGDSGGDYGGDYGGDGGCGGGCGGGGCGG